MNHDEIRETVRKTARKDWPLPIEEGSTWRRKDGIEPPFTIAGATPNWILRTTFHQETPIAEPRATWFDRFEPNVVPPVTDQPGSINDLQRVNERQCLEILALESRLAQRTKQLDSTTEAFKALLNTLPADMCHCLRHAREWIEARKKDQQDVEQLQRTLKGFKMFGRHYSDWLRQQG